MKTAIVTGANKGIGYEISRQLISHNFKVVMIGRRKGETEAAAERLMKLGGQVIPLCIDIGDDDSISDGLRQLDLITSKVDVLINNAAILEDRGSQLLHVDMDLLKKMIEINAYGALKMTRACIHFMGEGGRIVNMGSGAGSFGEGGSMWAPVYGISKILLNAITYHLAPELQERGIAINSMCPGWVQTDMGGVEAPRSVEEGAATAVWLATVAPHALTGKFFRDKEEILW
jgi:NAD(P)-dependent dehydrogenase (short-subunit alcohol dehydrogenase family)